jgi:hypothetical protein
LRNKGHFTSKILPTLGVSHVLLVDFVGNLFVIIGLDEAFPVSEVKGITGTGHVFES